MNKINSKNLNQKYNGKLTQRAIVLRMADKAAAGVYRNKYAISEIARRLNCSNHYVTKLLADLKHRGYINVERDGQTYSFI